MGVFKRAKQLTARNISSAPSLPGVYIIYRNNVPFYVGRSLRSVRARLAEHYRGSGKGSQKIRVELARGANLTFEAEAVLEEDSATEQGRKEFAAKMERFLIMALGTVGRGNLRYETDEDDWAF